VFTAANLISFARLLGVPLFLYLFLVVDTPGATAAAVAVLAAGGTSDWIDGYVARRFQQVSRIGELLDPLADRLYILATVAAFTVREVVPVAFTVALLLREAVLLVSLAVRRRFGYGPPPVHYLGKTATFLLLAAFPLLLLADVSESAAPVAHPAGWGLAWWGIVLYWLAGALYVREAVELIRGTRPAAPSAPAPAPSASPAPSTSPAPSASAAPVADPGERP
jgi:cardiolipin synthase (CMP-forming)